MSHDPFVPDRPIAVYTRALRALHEARVRFLVGGAYALTAYTGVTRRTKDLDVFCHPTEADRLLDVLARAGFDTTLLAPHWLGKAHDGELYVDVIFGSSNGIATVDEEWFAHASHGELMGVPVRFCPPEETIWSKAWVMDRERYDGADVAHLLLATAEELDWARLVRRFGPEHAPVLLSHLLLFGFVYPSERARVPRAVLRDLLDRVEEAESLDAEGRVCRGPLFSGEQYRIDVERWGYLDGRLRPVGTLAPTDLAHETTPLPGSADVGPGAAAARRGG